MMIRVSFRTWILLAAIGWAVTAGCANAPKPPPRFQLDPQQAAQEALTLYDKKGDGTLDLKELEASPPLLDLLRNLQAKSPGHPDSLTTADIAGRLEEWRKDPATLLPGMAMVSLDDKPLQGAIVTYKPEPFLGASFHSHQGQTNAAGMVQLTPEFEGYPGIYVGLYRICISKMVNGKETLPARYNTETELGREVAHDTRGSGTNIVFRLKTK